MNAQKVRHSCESGTPVKDGEVVSKSDLQNQADTTLKENSKNCSSDTVKNESSSASLNAIDKETDFACSEEPSFEIGKEPLHEQTLALEMMQKFHRSMKLTIYQCSVCHEAWPLKTKPKQPDKYVCSRCSRDKSIPKKFSIENSMIPSPVPKELQGLTQFEEMIIARAFPVMHVHTKPGVVRKLVKGMSLLYIRMYNSLQTYYLDAPRPFQ